MAIPGVTTTIRDRFYTVSRSDAPTGPRVVAIARRSTADGTGDIQDLDVVRALNEADVITAFGDGSDAHKAFIELVSAGAERIYIVPLPSATDFDHSTGGLDDGSGSNDIFQEAFDAAEAAIPDIIVAWGRGSNPNDWDDGATPSVSNQDEYGFHADNSTVVTSNWAYKVGAACKAISENTNPCIGVIGIKPYVTVSAERMTPGQISTHLGVANLPDKDGSDLFKSVGSYITVVAGEVKPLNYSSGTTSFGYANGASHFAATMSTLPSYHSTINKPLFNIESVRYSPTRTQQGNLAGKGVNPIIINFNKIAVFGESLTFAQTTSDYTRLTTKRIIDDATSVVRQVCQKFIGQASNVQVRNAMETAITSGLRGMQVRGALLSSDFTVTYVPNENKAIVDLVLTPAFELKNIEVRVAINL